MENKDDSEEEVLIYLEFNGMLHEDVFNEPNLIFKTLGFESENPILQIGEEIYEGEYDYSKGTNVFFEEDPSPSQGDPVFEKELSGRVKYLSKTNKILKMNRIFLKEKKKTPRKRKNEEPTVHHQPIELSDTYDEALDRISQIVISQLENEKSDNADSVEEDEKTN